MKLILSGTLLLFSLATLSACHPAQREIQVSTDLNETSLTNLWTTIADGTGVQPRTARLTYLQIKVTSSGSLQRFNLFLNGLNEAGRNVSYLVDMQPDGDIEWRENIVEKGDYPTQPGDLMATLDEVGLPEVAAEKGGLTLVADPVSGDIAYRQESLDIYLLEDGRKRRIKEIVFHGDDTWTTITVCKDEGERDERITESPSSTVVTETVRVGEGDECEIWFLEGAAAKAETLEFAE